MFRERAHLIIEREMSLDTGKIVGCNFQKAGGYELAVEVVIKPEEEFLFDREYPDWTRSPVRIRAAATALLEEKSRVCVKAVPTPGGLF